MSTETRHRRYDDVLGTYAGKDDEGRLDELDEVLHSEDTIYGVLGAGRRDVLATHRGNDALSNDLPELAGVVGPPLGGTHGEI